MTKKRFTTELTEHAEKKEKNLFYKREHLCVLSELCGKYYV